MSSSSSSSSIVSGSGFLSAFGEKLLLNQYWYSMPTLTAMAAEIESAKPQRVAFLSTPSVYFAISDQQVQANSTLFDFDESLRLRMARPQQFQLFDYRQPAELLNCADRGKFDYFVIDPPFITEEVWAKYAEAVRALAATEFKLLISTIPENHQFLTDLLQVSIVPFRPSIPNLIYQYSFYTNYSPSILNSYNPEIDAELIELNSPTQPISEFSAKKVTAVNYGSIEGNREEIEQN